MEPSHPAATASAYQLHRTHPIADDTPRSIGEACSYSVRIGWRTTTYALDTEPLPDLPSTSPRAPLLRDLALVPGASTFELRGLNHFFNGVAPTLVAFDVQGANPNWAYLPIALSGGISKAL